MLLMLKRKIIKLGILLEEKNHKINNAAKNNFSTTKSYRKPKHC